MEPSTTGVTQLIATNLTRAAGAGVDPHQYEQVTKTLTHVSEWTPTFTSTAKAHLRAADTAAERGHRITATACYLAAARWAHFATCWPNPDRAEHAAATELAARAYRHAVNLLDPDAQWIDARGDPCPFVGVLRHPAGVSNAPLTLLIPGLDSGKEEFHYLTEALLARGMAVFAFDGPGQAELSPTTSITPRYEQVVGHVLDVLGSKTDLGGEPTRVGAIALSLGGYYGVRAAAFEPRVTSLVIVSGVASLPWDRLPRGVIDTLTQRTGNETSARAFADEVDTVALARTLPTPLFVVAGGVDPIPSPDEARAVAAAAPRGRLHLVDGGDHLLANRHWEWIGTATDWLHDQLTG